MADEQIINETANPALNTSSLEKMLPKYCTSVQVALLNNAHIVLSMSYQEAPQPGILIERVIIDLEHANNLADILKSAVNETKENKLH
jgi:hypothetical protein